MTIPITGASVLAALKDAGGPIPEESLVKRFSSAPQSRHYLRMARTLQKLRQSGHAVIRGKNQWAYAGGAAAEPPTAPPGPAPVPTPEPDPAPQPSPNGEEPAPFAAYQRLVTVHGGHDAPPVRDFYKRYAHDPEFRRRADTLRRLQAKVRRTS